MAGTILFSKQGHSIGKVSFVKTPTFEHFKRVYGHLDMNFEIEYERLTGKKVNGSTDKIAAEHAEPGPAEIGGNGTEKKRGKHN